MVDNNAEKPLSRSNSTTDVLSYTEPWIDLFVPGRICLFGEHTDWAGQFRRFNSNINIGQTIVLAPTRGSTPAPESTLPR